jgi:NTP pyrophosphatase (non-canonical NTP hydrolase)
MPIIKHTKQTSLFDADIGEAKKQDGLERVERNANPEWTKEALDAATRVASRQTYFSSDDVWRELDRTGTSYTHQPAAMGAVFRKVGTQKIATATGNHTPSVRTETHRRLIMIWKSNLYETDNWEDVKDKGTKETIVVKEIPDSLTIKDLISKSYATAKSKGWHDTERSVPELLVLIHSEVSEALEEYRNHGYQKTYYRDGDRKPEGFPYEIADIIIRIADLSGHLKIDLEAALREKMKFNLTRSYRHDNKLA